MLEEVERWLAARSSQASDWPLERLLAAKEARRARISVVLPALDEEETVGAIVAAVREDLMEAAPLVDELLVVDSGSADRTAENAAAAGAKVLHRDEILPGIPSVPGKGEVLWRSLAATTGDLVCFVDADLKEFSSTVVTGVLGPLLAGRAGASTWSRRCTTGRWSPAPRCCRPAAAGSPSWSRGRS